MPLSVRASFKGGTLESVDYAAEIGDGFLRPSIRIMWGPKRKLAELDAACSKYQDEKLRSLSAKRVQCDEIWSFVGSKEKKTTADKKGIVDLLN
jgi:hypothetical protein